MMRSAAPSKAHIVVIVDPFTAGTESSWNVGLFAGYDRLPDAFSARINNVACRKLHGKDGKALQSNAICKCSLRASKRCED